MILLPVIVVMLTLMKMVICSPYTPFMLANANGDGGDYNGDDDLLTMYAKAIPTPYAINGPSELQEVQVFFVTLSR